MKKYKISIALKKYTLSVTEEVVQNPDYQWGRGGRIEVYENIGGRLSDYAVEEYRFFVPKEIFDKFHDLLDGLETDHPVKIRMDWKLS